MSIFWVVRKGDVLLPSESESAAIFSRLPIGKPLRAEVKNPRRGKHHRLFFLLIHRIANATDTDPEALRDHLTVEAGHYYEIKTKRGIRRYPKSISWSAMDQSHFDEVFERIVRAIYESFGIRREDVLAVVADLLAPKTEGR